MLANPCRGSRALAAQSRLQLGPPPLQPQLLGLPKSAPLQGHLRCQVPETFKTQHRKEAGATVVGLGGFFFAGGGGGEGGP